MPFTSKAQARFMFAVKPKLAKEFAAKTKSIAELPDKQNQKVVRTKGPPPRPKMK